MSAPFKVMFQCASASLKNGSKAPMKLQQTYFSCAKLQTKHAYNGSRAGAVSIKSHQLPLSFAPHPVTKKRSTFILTPSRFSSTLMERTCWKCGRKTNGRVELFICECGVVQKVSDLTYFQVFEIEETFDVDLEDLAAKYKDLQKILHPDKYSQKSEKERELSEMQSSLVNNAYTTLTKPLPRALYLLQRNGLPVEEDNSDVNPEFLLEIMEFNEDLAEAQNSQEDLQRIQADNDQRVQDCYEEVSKAFKQSNITLAKEHVIRLTYFLNITQKIKDAYRKSFE